MGIDERARHDLYLGLEELMGHERADALMGLLPPVGWADVATKHDLDVRFAGLEERIGLRFDAQAQSFRAELHSELRSQMRTLFLGLLTALLTMTSLCLTALAR